MLVFTWFKILVGLMITKVATAMFMDVVRTQRALVGWVGFEILRRLIGQTLLFLTNVQGETAGLLLGVELLWEPRVLMSQLEI
jgi:hypothetical protein